MVAEIRGEQESDWTAMTRVADLLGWVHRRRHANGYGGDRSTAVNAQARRRGSLGGGWPAVQLTNSPAAVNDPTSQASLTRCCEHFIAQYQSATARIRRSPSFL